jgi:hypothetical protein
MGISEQYTKEIQEQLKYSATWLPNIRISLGDVGTLENHLFHPQGNLSDFGIPFDKYESTGEAEFQFTSKDAVSVEAKLKGQAPLIGSAIAQADAGVTIKFGRENAVLFRATVCTSSRIKDIRALSKAIKDKHTEGQWDRKLVVVTQVISAKGTTVIISHGQNSQIDLSAKGNIGTGNINLADIGADFNIVRESYIATRIVAEPNLTPLFEAWALVRNPWKLFSETEMKTVRGRGIDVGGLEFSRVDYGDYALPTR